MHSKKSMKILAIHRYFWPDTPPYASLLRAIAKRWGEDGHRVDVLSCQPSYKKNIEIPLQQSREELDGLTVYRLNIRSAGKSLFIRLLNELVFVFSIFKHILLKNQYDVVMVSTVPPVLGGFVSCLAAKLTGAKFIYHCMDIHPEIGQVSGEFRFPPLFHILRLLDSYTCKNSSRVIVLSQDMKNALLSRSGASQLKIEVINNFDLPDFSGKEKEETPHVLKKRPGTFRLLFAGNIGSFQALETVIDAMFFLRERKDIQLVLLGEGKEKLSLKERAGKLRGDTVHFCGHIPSSQARKVMKSSDLGVVSLMPDIYKYAFPSKTMTYLSEGLPILAVVEDVSFLSEFIKRESVGIVTAQNKPKILADFIKSVADDGDMLSKFRVNVENYVRSNLEQSTILKRWSLLLYEI